MIFLLKHLENYSKSRRGRFISVGDIVCLIDTSESQLEELTQPAVKVDPIKEEKTQTTQKENISVTPLARSIASEKGIDLNVIKTKGEKITKDDVLKVVPAMGSSIDDTRVESREKLSMLRRKVSERLVSVKNETAMLTTFNEADLTKIFEIRKKYKEAFNLG